MSLFFLLDTNVLSEAVKPNPDPAVLRQLEAHENRVAMSAPVWQELLFGCRRLPASKRRDLLEEYLFEHLAPKVPILPYDDAAATWHAEERARLIGLGKTPSFVDGQIAAVASVNDLTLITRNRRDFDSFLALRIASWHSS